MSTLSQKQVQAVIVEMTDIANKIANINILSDSDCQSFYYLSGKSKIYKDMISSYDGKNALGRALENLYNILMFICSSKLAEVRRYLQRTKI